MDTDRLTGGPRDQHIKGRGSPYRRTEGPTYMHTEGQRPPYERTDGPERIDRRTDGQTITYPRSRDWRRTLSLSRKEKKT